MMQIKYKINMKKLKTQTYLPFGTEIPKNFNFTSREQSEYIFTKNFEATSGSIVIIKSKYHDNYTTVIFYFDNLSAQITSMNIFKGTINISIFTEFLKAAKDKQLFKPIINKGVLPQLNFKNFALVHVPKNFNRDWIFRELIEEGIILISYLWKDDTIPKVIKDLYSFFNNEFRSNPNSEVLMESVKDFNYYVLNKLSRLENLSSELEDNVNNNNSGEINIDSNGTTGGVNRKIARDIKGWPTTPNYKIGKRNFSSFNTLKDNRVYLSEETMKDITKGPRRNVIIEVENIEIDILIKKLVKKFKYEVQDLAKNDKKLLDSIKISTQFKVEFDDGSIRSCSAIDVINFSDCKFLENSYLYNWSERYSERYRDFYITKIIITYKILPEEFKRKLVSYISEADYKKSFTPKKINAQLPKTMDIKAWGELIVDSTNILECQIRKTSMIAHIILERSGDIYKNVILMFYKAGSGKPIKFIDRRDSTDSTDLTTFTRFFTKHKIIYKFVEGVQVLFKQTVDKLEFIGKLKYNKNVPKNKFITMDLETREISGKLSPICISIYTNNYINKISKLDEDNDFINKSIGESEFGGMKQTFAIWDYNNANDMLIAAFKTIMKRKYYGYNIYFHNFSYFDSIFIVKTLANLPETDIKPVFRDGKLLKLTIKFDPIKALSSKSAEGNSIADQPKYKGVLHIYDSLLILPASLDKLGKTFSVDDLTGKKSIFPLKFLNEVSDFDYEGVVPGLKYFYHPDPLNKTGFIDFLIKYREYKAVFQDTNWNLKKEIIKYCEQDVIVLHKVIFTFAKEIYKKFKINIFKYPTLPSIAFAIFRMHFMLETNIPIIKGKIYSDIKKAYYGGFVDSYEPYGENIKSYDVNSLYPASMAKCLMPVGNPTYFEGSLPLSDIFGFVYVKVYAPNLNKPILPYKDMRHPFTTRYPIGSWEGWYFSEELKNCLKYGYKFDIMKGYIFEESVLFTEYVTELYSIKQSVSPHNPWYMISKLLLNSLYGRFGMSPDMLISSIIDNLDLEKFNNENNVIIEETVDLGDKLWIQYSTPKTGDGEQTVGINNISVPIAAAITSWSRIHMSNYIMKYSDYIYNIDTDGIKVGCELNPEDVGLKLGQMKDEGDFKEAVFIAPKVYGGITIQNEMVTKIKGLKSVISYWHLKTLLYATNLKIAQPKWYRDFSNSTISIKDQLYTLAATNNKRELIRDSIGKLISTRPYLYENGELVKRSPFILYYLPIIISKFLLLSIPPQFKLFPIIKELLRLPLPLYNSQPTYNYGVIYLLPPVIYLGIPLDIIYLPGKLQDRLPLPKSFPLLPAPSVYLQLPAPLAYLHLPAPTTDANLEVKILKTKSVKVYNIKTDCYTTYSSLREASRMLGINISVISRRLSSKSTKPYKNHYIFYSYL